MADETQPQTLSIVPPASVRNGKKGGRVKGHTKAVMALKRSTVLYFCQIMTDDLEEDLWMAFITGMLYERDKNGNKRKDENGKPIMVPVKDKGIELTGVNWQAFKRAIEYKRGMPVVTVESNSEKVEVIIKTTGADPRFFAEQARLLEMAK